jgi:hypothetical protein
MLEMLRIELPVLLSLICCVALVDPNSWPAKFRVAGETDTLGAGAKPVPLSEVFCGLPAASSVALSVPVRVPPAVGVNVTLIVQFVPGARVAPQLFVSAKSPLAVMLEMLSTAFPEFVNLTSCAGLVVPGARLPNVRPEGERAATGAAETPVPERETDCGLPEALSVTESVAERAPFARGAKVMPIKQLEPGVRLAPQLFDWWKSPGFIPARAMTEIVSDALPAFVKVTL